MNTPEQDDKDAKAGAGNAKAPPPSKPGEAPAGNESNNPAGDPNDVGTAGDYSR